MDGRGRWITWSDRGNLTTHAVTKYILAIDCCEAIDFLDRPLSTVFRGVAGACSPISSNVACSANRKHWSLAGADAARPPFIYIEFTPCEALSRSGREWRVSD